jgi:hypothetical protein
MVLLQVLNEKPFPVLLSLIVLVGKTGYKAQVLLIIAIAQSKQTKQQQTNEIIYLLVQAIRNREVNTMRVSTTTETEKDATLSSPPSPPSLPSEGPSP